MEEIRRAKDSLHREFGIKDLSAAKLILMIQITRSSGAHQTVRAPISIPLPPNLQLAAGTEANPNIKALYRIAMESLIAAILWNSCLQSRIACSSTEAKYIALGHTGKEGVHLLQQLKECHMQTRRAPDLRMVMFGNN
ncbi:Gag-Pol polyprotein [Pseudohyphozyma bogoriensis]|nr:Gag-Pol polyprotein [Pseudohyphozyma bogoriensis]